MSNLLSPWKKYDTCFLHVEIAQKNNVQGRKDRQCAPVVLRGRELTTAGRNPSIG